VSLITNTNESLKARFLVNIDLRFEKFCVVVRWYLVFVLDRFNLECPEWASCNVGKCNEKATMTRGAMEECVRGKHCSF
jgi:hypothetical protein